MAGGKSLICGDCGVQLRDAEEAMAHGQTFGHTNFSESTEAVLSLVCTTCGKPCRSSQEKDLHTTRTGHKEFYDKTNEMAAELVLETPASTSGAAGVGDVTDGTKLVVPTVNEELKLELEGMGFSTAKATRALYYSGASDVEGAINWIIEHESDKDIEEMPMVPEGSSKKPTLTPAEQRAKAQELVERARKIKEEEEKKMEREREKERIRAGKEILEAKRIEEEQERRRIIAFRKAEKEEERRARERIRQKLEEDRAERRRKLGLPPEDPADQQKAQEAPPAKEPEKPKASLPVRPATKAEQMRSTLRTLKQTHKGDDAQVKRAFETLLTYIGNVARSPGEEKFRKIRLTNATFKDRVGKFEEGLTFLKLCGFESDSTGEFFVLAQDKVDMVLLNTAGSELDSAIKNPFFGVL
eukprot:TRINITY_DN6061_c0_g1_i1.p1 TRINITY_DN6061_c0_g1~~TRINITY_DN6061_c0_g1_i1.p1  ORF type:complete len:413 (+),score=101.42 TRINITY_DN6061_c0_g1_i1:64-1302(+)